jgi:hypothetical protein
MYGKRNKKSKKRKFKKIKIKNRTFSNFGKHFNNLMDLLSPQKALASNFILSVTILKLHLKIRFHFLTFRGWKVYSRKTIFFL